MKEIKGYLIDRTTGAGISGKTVTFKDLSGTDISTGVHGTVYQVKDTVTQSDGSFSFICDLSPGPILTEVEVSGSEFKERFDDEKAQMGVQWASDISRLGRIANNGVVRGHLSELAPSVSAGNIRVATGTAIIDGIVWNLEHGVSDTGFYTVAATANGGGSGINPRLDLVTLRQYKESASGQDSGRQSVVVTLGSVSNVVPSVPTGSDFTDLAVGVISTPAGGSPSLSLDRREFINPTTADKASLKFVNVVTDLTVLNGSYVNRVTVTATGLDPNKTYDGYIDYSSHSAVTYTGFAFTWPTYGRILSTAFPAITADPHNTGIEIGYQGSYNANGEVFTKIDYAPIGFRAPIVGVTGISTLDVSVGITWLSGGSVSGGSFTSQFCPGKHRAVLMLWPR